MSTVAFGRSLVMTTAFCAAMSAGSASATAPERLDPGATAPVPADYDEKLVVGFPTGGRGWRQDNSFNQPTRSVSEWVQEGESVHNWTEIITEITLKDRPEADTAAMIESIVGGMTKRCPSLRVLSSVADRAVDEGRRAAGLAAEYRTYTAFVRCDDPLPSSNPDFALKKHEVTWFKGIQGWKTAYIVERAWHGDDIAPGSILESDKTRAAWQTWSDGVGIRGLAPGQDAR